MDFLDHIPLLDASVPLPDEVRGQNPEEIASYVYKNHAVPIPIRFYIKFISDGAYDSYEPADAPPIIRLAKEIVSDFDLSDFESEEFNPEKCVWIRSQPKGSEPVDSLLVVTAGGQDVYVIGGRISSRISITQSKGKPYVGSDHPINFSVSDEGVYIANINKSSIVGHETGKQNVLIALAISRLFNPEGKANVTIFDAASIPCTDVKNKNNENNKNKKNNNNNSKEYPDVGLSYLRFLTKEKVELSWYNSFGFESQYDVDLDRMAEYQAKLQSLSMTDIADYFDKLLQVMKQPTTYFVIQGIAFRITDQFIKLMDPLTRFVETVREAPCSLKDFFTKKENCIFFELLPTKFPIYFESIAPTINSSIPIAFIYNEPGYDMPTYRVYPLAKEFRYVVTHIGSRRIIKGTEYNKPSENNNNNSTVTMRSKTSKGTLNNGNGKVRLNNSVDLEAYSS